MSTEIKNTLFRFVTMRAPKLLEKEIIKKTFVQYPELKEGSKHLSLFLQAIKKPTEGKTKKEILISVANDFETISLKTREDIFEKSLFSKEFFNFAVWLTSNRTSFSIQELEIEINKIETTFLTTILANSIKSNSDFGIANEKLISLWDNLFYQIITFKSGYVREAVLSALVAYYFLSNYTAVKGNLEQVTKLASARVIIPKILLDNEETIVKNNSEGSAKTTTFVNTKTLDKEMDLILNKQKIELLQNSVKELNKVQTMYNKQNQKALELASKNYQKKIDAITSKATIVERVVVDPITNEKTVVREYENLKIPSFEFVKKLELNKNFLKDKVSKETLNLIENLSESNNFDTFKEILNHLDQEVNNATQLIFENTNLNENLISNKGVLIPVSNRSNDSQNSFTIGGEGFGSWFVKPLNLIFGDDFQDVNIVAANYKATFEDNSFVEGTTFEGLVSNSNLSVKIFNTGLDTSNYDIFHLTGYFELSNGNRINIIGDAIISRRRRIFSSNIIKINGNGTYKLEIKGNDNNSGSLLEYIPSGFGIKRLGIADYRKVEQEICCYVPGEVSHIENVMASEYKERSTRMLRRSENTTTSSTEKETEKLTDTTSADRFEMQQEVASVLAEDTQIGINAGYQSPMTTAGQFSANADFANNTSSEESNSQAVTHAKDVTERVLDRVVLKVKEERVSKVIEEFEENNKHGFDNRSSKDHVSGVYRWVDKIYRNQVLNYGKRLIYEFMIPEPASFHTAAINESKKNTDVEILVKPIDPRNANADIALNLDDTFELRYKYWAKIFNASYQACPDKIVYVGKSADYSSSLAGTSFSKSDSIQIPQNYISESVTMNNFVATPGNSGGYGIASSLKIGNSILVADHQKADLKGFQGAVPFTIAGTNCHVVVVNISVECFLSEETKQQWQIDTFNVIIKAYETKLSEYNSKVAQAKAMQSEKVRTNPMFYRQIENMVLRKNCIEYLASHEALGAKSMLSDATDVQKMQVLYNDPALEIYASKVKFFEQAFEWGLMSYNFYPFYWANKTNWASLYNINETDDAVFRAFLQSGMARVIVTVRPGFEEAVNWYMKTGQVWNGGQVTTVDDPLFISIVDELRTTTGKVEETWESRVPTSLTVIQAGSLGLEVTQALPCDEDCKDYKLFDSDGNPVLDTSGNPKSTNPFVKSDVTLHGVGQEPIKAIPSNTTPTTGTK